MILLILFYSIATSQVATPSPVEETKKITVILNVEQPEIVLVEKMDDMNCHALILNGEIGLKFRMIGDRQVLKGDINALNLYMCEFNPSRRQATKHYVLHPCALSLNGSTPEGKGLHLSLQISMIKLCISPSIVELLNKVLVTMTTQEKTEENEIKPLPDYSEVWKASTYDENDFWFIKPQEAIDIVNTNFVEGDHKAELCIAELPSIVLIIETGTGYQTIPMLYIETSMQAKIHNWSWQLSIDSSLRLSVSYFNSSLALWEPLIELNERETPNGTSEYGPWELSFSMDVVKEKGESGEEEEPRTKICVQSKDILEMTVTKTCLDVLQNLGNAFSEAITAEGLVKPDVEAPYVIQNDTGFEITLNLANGAFLLHNSHLPNSGYFMDESTSKAVIFMSDTSNADLSPSDVTIVKISAGGKAYLQLKPELCKSDLTIEMLDKNTQEKCIHVRIGDIEKELVLPVHKADERFFPLYRDTHREPWGIVSDVKMEFGNTVITVRGILQVQNHFTAPISIYRLKDGVAHLVHEIQPGALYNVPLHAIYTAAKELYFSMQGYKISIQGISWKESPSDFNLIRTLQCDPMSTFEPFYMNVSLCVTKKMIKNNFLYYF